MKEENVGRGLGVASIPVYLVCTIHLLDLILLCRFNAYGIVPRPSRCLLGILFSNTVPLFVLSLLMTLLAVRYERAKAE